MTQRSLRTARLELIPLSIEHRDDIIRLNSDADVMKYLESKPLSREASIADHRQRVHAADKRAGLGYWAGYMNGNFVGWWALSPVHLKDGIDPSRAEVGYRLLPLYWRQGFAKEGAKELLRHGFQDLQLVQVFAQTMAVNQASRATMAACGLRHARTFYLEFDDPIPGTNEGEVEYRLTKEEWTAAQSSES